MTISSEVRKAGPFSGTGLVSVYPFAFKVFTPNDLLVIRTDSSGSDSTLVLNSDYTVTLNPNQAAAPGGSIVLSVALPVGFKLTATSKVAQLQPVDLTNNGGFFPSVINAALDRLTILVQQLSEKVGRTLRFPISDGGSVSDLPSAAQRANNLLGFDPNGNPVAVAPSSGSAADVLIKLAKPTGAGLVGKTGGGSVQNFIDNILSEFGSSFIGYKLNAIGSFLRTIYDKLSERVSVKDFGATGSGTVDETIAINKAIATGKKLYFPAGLYACNLEVNNSINWTGDGSLLSRLIPYDISKPVVKYNFIDEIWSFASISDISMQGPGAEYTAAGAAGVGFSFGDPANYTPRIEYSGRVTFNRVVIRGFHKGVQKSYGNIGNVFNQCSIQNNNYGLWARSAKLGNPAADHMQPDTDTFNGGEFHGNAIAACCYIAKDMAVGQLQFNQTVIQFNPGFGIFFDAPGCNGVNAAVANNVWLEGNGTLDTVTIDTANGSITIKPQDMLIRGIWEYAIWGSYGHTGGNGIGTVSPNASLGIWGNQRNAINLISGGYSGPSWTRLAFSEQGTESVAGACIESHVKSGTARDLRFRTNNLDYIPLLLSETGSVVMGDDAVKFGSPLPGAHLMYGPNGSGGDLVLAIASKYGYKTNFFITDSDGRSSALCAMGIGKVAATGRSINAGGTINASGADYAEYLTKSKNCPVINKGDIVGLDVNGEITDKWNDSLSFLIKTTNPSYVGGDTWASSDAIGAKPEYPDMFGLSDIENEIAHNSYLHRISVFETAVEAARNTVDRLSFSGQVPVNVIGANVGDYIVPVNNGGIISGKAVKNPSIDEYLLSVGKVIRFDDNRPIVIVKSV